MQKFLFVFLLLTSLQLSAQDDDLGKRTTIVFLTSEVIANDNFDNEGFITWVKAVQQVAGNVMKTEKTNSTVRIIANWVKGGKCQYDISVCPANNGLSEKINLLLKNTESPVAKMAPFQLLFTFKFNDGCKETETFAPVHLTSDEKLQAALSAQSLSQQRETIRNWALQEVIPVLSYYTSSVSDQFAGVKETGKILEKKSFLDNETNTVTDKNPLYWRGLMEMNKGNLIISISKVFMYVANGEFDIARRYINMLYRFADKESLATHYMLDLNKYLAFFYEQHDSLVNEGIKLHDAGKYDKAIEKYKSILTVYPHSSWAKYELYYSTEAAAGKAAAKTTALWNQHKEAVYASDPLYPMGGGANNGKDAYILFRHLQVKELFNESKNLKNDLIEYAGIALDLETYAFAAHLYWYLATVFPSEKYKGHSFLVYFLYSLQKQGVTEVQSFFKDDYKKEFGMIDTERAETMKKDPTYRSFKE
jgi:tetratricopeptide (TPR) repeat protein